ncbi:hypothetical protein NEAUS05_0822 [Nematocida ausubeli]|nr:hypothetical protein NEAUS07_2060 [Nematocida ausubeli]KAI5147522.1 hypothetical protein NEAUS05_0822 [Nematocida ausubeli]
MFIQDCPQIAYKLNGNEIRSGLINILTVICKVAGIYDEWQNALDSFTERICGSDVSIHCNLYFEVEECVQHLFKQFSKNKNVEIKCFLEKCIRSDGVFDIFGAISITYALNDVENSINLFFYSGHTTIQIPQPYQVISQDFLDALMHVKNACTDKASLLGSLLNMYIQNKINDITSYEKRCIPPKQEILHALRKDVESMDALLMCKKIEGIEYKKKLIECSLIYAHALGIKLTKEHPFIIFTSNLLGSIDLSNKRVQEEVLPSLVYSKATDLYPNILLSKQKYAEILLHTTQTIDIFEYLLDMNNPDALFSCLKAFISTDRSGRCSNNPFKFKLQGRDIFNCLFQNENLLYLQKIKQHISQSGNSAGYINNIVYFPWFVYICEKEHIPDELILQVYDMLPEDYSIWYLSYVDISDKFHWTLNTLNRLKSQLCARECSLSKFNNFYIALTEYENTS